MNRSKWVFIVLVASLIYNGWTYYQNYRFHQFLDLVNQKDRLQTDQMNEITVMMYNKTNENIMEVARQQGKLEGMLSVIHGQKLDLSEHSQVWHSGYNRGIDQNKSEENTLKVINKK